jgi:hypothetical protein
MKFVLQYLLPQLASTIKLKKAKKVVKKLSKIVKKLSKICSFAQIVRRRRRRRRRRLVAPRPGSDFVAPGNKQALKCKKINCY